MPIDDRTTRARIRDAAIEVVAAHGTANTTARAVAAAAGVSAGSVINHFGTMEALEQACDHHVAALIREAKTEAMTAGPSLDPLAAMRDADSGPQIRYLARRLVEDAPAVADLVDEMVDDAVVYMEEGVASGMLRPSADPRGRAVLLTLWSLGALVMHDHVRRLLDLDLTAPDFGTSPEVMGYLRPAFEVLGEGIFTDQFAENLRAQLPDGAHVSDPDPPDPGAPLTSPPPSTPGASATTTTKAGT